MTSFYSPDIPYREIYTQKSIKSATMRPSPPPPSSHASSVSSLDRQRQHLEKNVRELQRSLYDWRMWEAEYDGLKLALQEENTQSNDAVKAQDMLDTALEYISSSSEGAEKSVLTAAEVRDILCGSKTGVRPTRSKEQVLSLLDRRIDYVRDNIRVLERRLDDAERKLENWMGSIAVEDESQGQDEQEGKGGGLLPVTEIVEELDEEGNVVNGETVRAGESAMALLDMLKKAGVEGLDGDKVEKRKRELKAKKDEQNETKEAPAPEEETKNEILASKGKEPVTSAAESSNVSPMSNISVKGTSTNGTVEIGSEDEDSIVMEIDESPEDAALRREMLQYGLQEVGAVVAELELDEDDSEFSITDDEEEEDEYGRTTQGVLDEDYHRQMRELEEKLNARSIQNIGPNSSTLPEEVQHELHGEFKKVALNKQEDDAAPPEKKTGKPKKRVAFAEELDIAPNRTPAPETQKKKDKAATSPEVAPIQEQIIERAEPSRTNNASEMKPPKKASRFRSAKQEKESTPAIAPATQEKDKVVKSPEVAAFQEKIVERAERDHTKSPAEMEPPKRASRFKSARKAKESIPATTPAVPTIPQMTDPSHAQTTHSLPQDITLFPATPLEPKPFSQPIVYPDEPPVTSAAKPTPTKILQDTLVERPISSIPLAPEHNPDDFDEAFHQREIATEFYRLRNRKIQQEGGFLRDEEDESIVPIDDGNDDEDGGRKMSKFMAARLRKQ